MVIQRNRRFFLILLIFVISPSGAGSSESMTLITPDSTLVTICRDRYGVPHIVADSEVGVF